MSGVLGTQGPGLEGVGEISAILARRGESDIAHKLETFRAAAGHLATSIAAYDNIPGAPESEVVETARAFVRPVVVQPTRIQH